MQVKAFLYNVYHVSVTAIEWRQYEAEQSAAETQSKNCSDYNQSDTD
jgi:hypothetical protein